MERGLEYCSFCSKTQEEVAHLFVADHSEAAICGKCVEMVSESYRKVLGGEIEYASWSSSSSAASHADDSKEKP